MKIKTRYAKEIKLPWKRRKSDGKELKKRK